eukprot:Gb_11038 [translate_table: standard]
MKLLGCCIEGSERLFVYEFLPNRSLDKILFSSNISFVHCLLVIRFNFMFYPKRKNLLEWKVRHEIIVEITHGLA